ncbi:jg19763 [Pararge aegeria aegeria]|uniref:Jg19763 protein n=1 Tax=Pararge aegeria aegeria TaxID=348720 RepID=A0A8S4SAY7_9NEOP|nr:jg19763 [Pararge aegeria aegeria]
MRPCGRSLAWAGLNKRLGLVQTAHPAPHIASRTRTRKRVPERRDTRRSDRVNAPRSDDQSHREKRPFRDKRPLWMSHRIFVFRTVLC